MYPSAAPTALACARAPARLLPSSSMYLRTNPPMVNSIACGPSKPESAVHLPPTKTALAILFSSCHRARSFGSSG